MKIFATTIPIWEGNTLQYVTANSEQQAAKSRGELEFELDPSTAGCFESGLEISVIDADAGWEPSNFRVYATASLAFHATRTDEL